jgi:hypothetical protein
MKKIFIICPVRNSDEAVNSRIRIYIQLLERQGYTVHWPPRNTDQNDPIGNMICLANMKAALEADEIHIWYDPNSTGSHFDLGGVFMLIEVLGYRKRVVFMNSTKLPPTPQKSFINVIRYLAEKNHRQEPEKVPDRNEEKKTGEKTGLWQKIKCYLGRHSWQWKSTEITGMPDAERRYKCRYCSETKSDS